MRQYLNELTAEMENDEYAAFMRELADWADDQAQVAEYELSEDDEF